MCVTYSTSWWFKPFLKTVFPQLLLAMPVSRYNLTSGLTTSYVAGLTKVHQHICANFHLTATSKGSLKDTILGFIHTCTIQGKLCVHALVPRFAEGWDTRVTAVKVVKWKQVRSVILSCGCTSPILVRQLFVSFTHVWLYEVLLAFGKCIISTFHCIILDFKYQGFGKHPN